MIVRWPGGALISGCANVRAASTATGGEARPRWAIEGRVHGLGGRSRPRRPRRTISSGRKSYPGSVESSASNAVGHRSAGVQPGSEPASGDLEALEAL